MSNIHHRNAWHGLDDEPGAGPGGRCLACWSSAKRKFFSSPRRRGRTLQTVYAEIHGEAHS